MMEVQPFRGKHYDADCRQCDTSYRGSYKQANEVRETHNARLHPRRWRRYLRRLEILDELQDSLRAGRLQDIQDGVDPWSVALPFDVPPLRRARLKEEGLI